MLAYFCPKLANSCHPHHPPTSTPHGDVSHSPSLTGEPSGKSRQKKTFRSKTLTGRKRNSKSISNGGSNEESHSHHSHSESSMDSESANSSLVSVKSGFSRRCLPGTLGARRWQMFQMIVLPFIPILALVVQNSSLLSTVVTNMKEAGEIKQQIGMIVQIGKLLAELQQERAEFGYCLFTNDSNIGISSSSSRTMTLSSPAPITIKSLPIKGTHRSLPISTTKTGSTKPNISNITNQSSSLTLDLDRGDDYDNHLQPAQLPPLPLLISSPISSSLPPPPLLPTAPVSMKSTPSQLPQLLLHSDRVSLCRVSLSERFQRTDSVIQSLPEYVAAYVPTVININEKRQKVFFYTETVGSSDDTALDELIWYNVANDVILDLLNQRIRKAKSTGIWKPLIAYMNMIRTIENYSVSMVYGLYYFGKGELSQSSFNKYIKFDSLAADYLDATKSFSPEIRNQWETYISSTWRAGFENLVERRLIIYKNIGGGSTAADIPSAKMYYANMTVYIEELRGFQVKLREMIENQVSEELTQAQAKQAIAAFVLVLVLGISPIIIVLVRQVTSTIQTYSLNLSSKSMQLKRERRRSDKLLEQMLPAEVIKQLKKNRQVPAENFECVTIYFSDIVSFTKISSTSSPMEVIVMLNSLYKLFDSKIELYDVYKVETIGDAYMVVSGLPLRNANRHAGEICTMALDLIAGVKQFQIPHRPGTPLQIRVGVNSGACVAGVVGTKMPRYCLFGDAINVASRMESHGEALKIHVTEHTKQILDELGGYILEPRGQLEVKGKGAMSTFWLLDMEGGLPTKNVELSTPGFFKQAAQAPEFLHELFGSSGSEDGDDVLKKILPPIISSSSTARHPPSILQTTSIAVISSEKKSIIRQN